MGVAGHSAAAMAIIMAEVHSEHTAVFFVC